MWDFLLFFFFFLTGCTDDIVTSDHSPVFATYEVGVTSQFVSKKGIKHNVEILPKNGLMRQPTYFTSSYIFRIHIPRC